MTSYLSPDEYFNGSMHAWPFLYASKSEHLSRLKVFDHLFNTLGNGVVAFDRAIRKDSPSPALFGTEPKFSKPAEHFFDHTALFYPSKSAGIQPKYNDFVTLEHTLVNPHIAWKLLKKSDKHQISLNLPKNFCIFWNYNFADFGLEWCHCALDYFMQAKDVLIDMPHPYPTQRDLDSAVFVFDNYNDHFLKKPEMSQTEFFELISKQHNRTYEGNTRAFLLEGFEIDKIKTISHFDASIERAQQHISHLMLSTRKRPKP